MAARYWVGGTGTWDATAGTKWALTSGGAGGQTVPTSSDTVFFDANSGANTVTLNSGYNPTISTLTMTGFTGTLAFGTQNITLNGNNATIYNQPTIMSVTGTPVINCSYSGATGTRTISTGSVTESNSVSFNISTGTDIVSVTSVVKNLNFTGFSGTFGNIARTIYGNLTISSGMTLTAGTAITTFGATSGTQQVTSNGKTLDFPITMSGTSTVQLQDNLTMGSTRTFTLTSGTLDLNNKTLSTGLFSSANSNTRSVLFGTGNITVTGSGATVWNTATATNFSYTGTPTVNFTYSGSTGTRTIAQASAGNGGSETNSVDMNISAGSDTVTFGGASRIYRNTDFTGFTGTYTNAAIIFVGNLKFSSGMTVGNGTNAITFASTLQQQNITTNNQTLDFPISFTGTNTYQFQDALTQGSTRITAFVSGTLKLKASVTSTFGNFTTTGTTLKYLQSTTAGTQATISQSSGTVNATYLTIQDSAATGGASWYALFTNNNVSSGNNSGWIFATPILSTSTTNTSTIGFQYTFAKLLSYLSTSVATIKNLPNKLLSATSTSVVSTQRFISKIFRTISEMSVVVLTESAFHLVLLSITESNVASIIKSISKTFTTNSTSSASLAFIQNILKTLSIASTSTATMVRKYAVGKVISISVNSTASLVKTAQKYLTVVSTNTTTLIRSINVTLKAFSATISTLVFAVFPKLGAVIRYTFTADMRDNLIQLFKQRNVRANESNKKVQK
jgi:hypothetical protein